MLILPKLLALIPVAQTILWVMLAVAVWMLRDLMTVRLASRRVIQGKAQRPRLRWKVAVLSSLAATLVVVCLMGVMPA